MEWVNRNGFIVSIDQSKSMLAAIYRHRSFCFNVLVNFFLNGHVDMLLVKCSDALLFGYCLGVTGSTSQLISYNSLGDVRCSEITCVLAGLIEWYYENVMDLKNKRRDL